MHVILNDLPARGCWMTAYEREELYDQAYEDGRRAEREAFLWRYETSLKAWSALTALLGFAAGVLLAPLFS